jgi:hypothetical protein
VERACDDPDIVGRLIPNTFDLSVSVFEPAGASSTWRRGAEQLSELVEIRGRDIGDRPV